MALDTQDPRLLARPQLQRAKAIMTLARRIAALEHQPTAAPASLRHTRVVVIDGIWPRDTQTTINDRIRELEGTEGLIEVLNVDRATIPNSQWHTITITYRTDCDRPDHETRGGADDTTF